MSLDHTSGAPDRPHLDEEAVSAALDGEAAAGAVAHLERCSTCRASVERLRAAQAAVAAPVELDAGAREAAVAAALGAFGDGRVEDPGDAGVRTLQGRGGGGLRRGAPVPWLAIAAVLLLVVLAVPLLRGAGGGPAGGSDSEAAGEATAGDGADSETSASAVAPPVDVGDLGAIEVGEDLRPVLDAALGAGPDGEATPEEDAGAAPDRGIESEAGSSDEGAESGGGGAPGEAGDSGPEQTTRPEAVAGPEGGVPRSGSEEEAFREARAACEPAVRAALPEAGALVLVGSGTVDGAPAVVFGFTGPGERPAVLTALVRRAGCELVTFQSYVRG